MCSSVPSKHALNRFGDVSIEFSPPDLSHCMLSCLMASPSAVFAKVLQIALAWSAIAMCAVHECPADDASVSLDRSSQFAVLRGTWRDESLWKREVMRQAFLL